MTRTFALLALAGLAAQQTYAQVTYPPLDPAVFATKSEVQTADSKAQAASDAAAGSVKTVNGQTPVAGAVTVPVPTASSMMPPAVTDSGSTGTMTTVFALANHTHAGKARRGRVLVPVGGVLDVTFSSSFAASTPICAVTAEATPGDTNVVNAQIDGAPTMTGMRVRIARTQLSVVSLLGLTILSVPTQVATLAHYVCLEP